jgi:hypothetical protein
MFRLRVTTDEVTNVLTSDDLTVELRGCGGLLLPALATYSNLEAGPGYTAEDLDVTAFKGRHVDGGDDAVLQRERMVAFGIADDPRDLAAVVEPVGLRRRQLWPGLGAAVPPEHRWGRRRPVHPEGTHGRRAPRLGRPWKCRGFGRRRRCPSPVEVPPGESIVV